MAKENEPFSLWISQKTLLFAYILSEERITLYGKRKEEIHLKVTRFLSSFFLFLFFFLFFTYLFFPSFFPSLVISFFNLRLFTREENGSIHNKAKSAGEENRAVIPEPDRREKKQS